MGLRIKVFSGFIILAIMLLVAGLWSIYQLNLIGSSVQEILDENYSSVNAAKNMMESLEREDSGILLLLLGSWEEGRAIIESADSTFNSHYQFAYQNITIPQEKIHLDSIQNAYRIFKKLWERPIVGTVKQGDFKWYFEKVHEQFLSLKKSINSLIALNDKNMYKMASDLRSKSKAAIMPGIIAVLSALIFTFIFTYLTNHFMISPIIKITNRIKMFIDRKVPFHIEIETKDELSDLEDSIRLLCDLINIKDE
jgi:hypothetical protein